MLRVLVLVHCARPRLARQEVSLAKPSARAGAQVGTVRATTSPFFTGIEVSSGNCADSPKYGSSLMGGPWAMSFQVRLGFFCSRRIAMAASAGPPSLVLKNLIWLAFGLDCVIVHATIDPER